MSNFNKYLKGLAKDGKIGRVRTIPCKECGKEVPIDLSQTCKDCNQKSLEPFYVT